VKDVSGVLELLLLMVVGLLFGDLAERGSSRLEKLAAGFRSAAAAAAATAGVGVRFNGGEISVMVDVKQGEVCGCCEETSQNTGKISFEED